MGGQWSLVRVKPGSPGKSAIGPAVQPTNLQHALCKDKPIEISSKILPVLILWLNYMRFSITGLKKCPVWCIGSFFNVRVPDITNEIGQNCLTPLFGTIN